MKLHPLLNIKMSQDKIFVYCCQQANAYHLPKVSEINSQWIPLGHTQYLGSEPSGYLTFSQETFEGFEWISLDSVNKFHENYGSLVCEFLSMFWAWMPMGLKDFENSRLPSIWAPPDFNLKEEICFYGGSFYPLHQGHLECARQCPTKQLVIVPDFNPLKDIRQGYCAFENYKNIKLVFDHPVYPGFCGLGAPNPTVKWLTRLEIPNRSLIIGDDNLKNLPKWQRWKEVLSCLSCLYVVPRDLGEEDFKLHLENLRQEFPSLKIKHLKNHPYQQVSSTKLREVD